MRLLLLTQLFHPEPNWLKGLAFARALQAEGIQIQVLCTFPNYPGGRIYPGYRQRLWQREEIQGIEVFRVPVYPSHDRSGLKRALTFGSAAVALATLGPWLVRRPDVIHVYQGPATLVLAARVLSWRFRCPFLLDVQDLWPESVLDSGMLRLPGAERLLHWWCDRSYRRAARIVVLSPGYRAAIERRGIPGDKLSVVYNWCDPRQEEPLPEPGPPDPHGLGGSFNVIYAGNLGPLQALETVLESARRVQDRHPEVQFVFIGDGVQKTALQRQAAGLDLKNTRFLGRLTGPELRSALAQARALLISLRDTALTRVGIPSKTQSCLAAGRPILAAVEGEARRVIEESGAGVVCSPEDVAGLVEGVERLVRMPDSEREAYGKRGREFYLREMSFAAGLPRMRDLIREVAKAGHEG
ncbi:MAG: glycosyltransferase family 4 protein [Verrucomicrobia bacterium]|nr:glycosyltransferase family 4 protein [Verrucomicrobiota bacterium]